MTTNVRAAYMDEELMYLRKSVEKLYIAGRNSDTMEDIDRYYLIVARDIASIADIADRWSSEASADADEPDAADGAGE